MNANTTAGSLLGRDTAYPTQYDAALLYPIPRALARAQLGIATDALPFIGHDRWQAFELSWLDARGKPHVATATLHVPAASPNLIESKSLKLYLNSFNASRFDDADAVRALVEADLTRAASAPVTLAFGLPAVAPAGTGGTCIDELDTAIDNFGPPDATLLHATAAEVVEETLCSALLKSNCPVTGQPDWADVTIAYRGPRIDRAGLLRYLVSFRDHAEFHEQCVERIFIDILARCAPQRLSVHARYTRRGGLDINPWRATPGHTPPTALRSPRQ
ncbi:NADPH-dependent 7-cyano-7-deazaguanine reductase QueF [Thermomonas paludicola]|uniref:NADPH-dependent 7-cyano-7-deazaguanine reductase QueF n=1 Tax=Thermomonas paludicola TaxID=2884874 RepID=UPI0021147DFC|nr:NADPH-dependent 7-cyano-7-deazaguanine reductase QueF [Thermomonas paludicola]